MTEKHTHKLKKVKYKSGNSLFFCTLDCTYKISATLALGKKTICWRCGETFSMNDYSIRLIKPHCENCHKPKDASKSPKEAYRQTESEVTENTQTSLQPSTPSVVPSLAEKLNQALRDAQDQSNAQNEEEDI